MGREAEPIYEYFVFNKGEDNPELNYQTIIGKFDEHFVPKGNLIHDCACLHERMQKPCETVEAFVRSLYEFGMTKDEQIQDRMVNGMQDNDVFQKLRLEPDLTLEKAFQLAWQSEQIKKQICHACRLFSEYSETQDAATNEQDKEQWRTSLAEQQETG
ncbi:hypothetical protein F2P81_016638 [Scophthalmus maximus]|uniref:Retrotransposon gag domain-containing protein n=1 Tax=Scophthalmus maximus TaxID=52904 RepID=A0A6A4SD49_SCOMX|nr:hypothetical protein F2P81_016638 [Scophthalmus maximus]